MARERASARTLVVVFGAAVRPDGSASPTLARRVGYAAAAVEGDSNADLFLSGAMGTYPPSEAAVMASLLAGTISPERMTLDETSRDTLQTVRSATSYARANGYAQVLACTDAYHQPRVTMLFRIMGLTCRPVRLASRGPRRLRIKMWLREGAAIPYDLVAGVVAARADRSGHRTKR